MMASTKPCHSKSAGSGVRTEHTPDAVGLLKSEHALADKGLLKSEDTRADKGLTNIKPPTDLRSVPGDGL